MSLTRKERNEIKEYILWNIEEHPNDIVRFTKDKYKLSRPTILRYLFELAHQNKIEIEGSTRNRKYTLKPFIEYTQTYKIQKNLAEDKVWRTDIAPLFSNVSKNIVDICHYGFTEIFNNAIDHSEGSTIIVSIGIWIDHVIMSIDDNGVGIFNKIQKKYNLDDPSHAILELSKGKLTTEPASHTGEGIFFTSRMFDTFVISSGMYSFVTQKADVLFEADENKIGTEVLMQISLKSDRTTESVFSKFVNDLDTYGFNKTIVPVQLVRYGNENIVSRSQAKRLLARLERFKTVVLDFQNIESIGRAFADEIFRVFPNNHPNTTIYAMNENKSIKSLIREIQKDR